MANAMHSSASFCLYFLRFASRFATALTLFSSSSSSGSSSLSYHARSKQEQSDLSLSLQQSRYGDTFMERQGERDLSVSGRLRRRADWTIGRRHNLKRAAR